MKIIFNKKKIFIQNVKKLSWFEKGIGLMFSSRKNAKALLFEFKKPVKISFTSWFVFFPFLIIWIDNKNNLLNFKKINPFTFHIPSGKPFKKVLEIPFNDNYEETIGKFSKFSTRALPPNINKNHKNFVKIKTLVGREHLKRRKS
ncbi:DUF192 domain-containing protein [Candidatus Woesearchaeota archaeon]|nr:DUF192 domain-containing protein [Candidatus Woesearchaeota archaeon]